MNGLLVVAAFLAIPAGPPQELPDTSSGVDRAERAIGNYRKSWGPPGARQVCVGSDTRDCWGGDWAAGGWCLPNQRCNGPPTQMITTLLSTAAELPHSGYVVGHTVFALSRFDRHLEALQVAQTCRAEAWWCQALQILVFQDAGRPDEASAVFATLEDEASEETLCDLHDATSLLGSRDPRGVSIGWADAYRRWTEMSCGSRLAASDTVFWLADPLYVIEGNDRQVEHLVRRAKARLANEVSTATIGGNLTAEEHTEVLVTRRGPWDSYDRVNRRSIVTAGVAYPVWASTEAAPYHFVPDFPDDGLEGLDRPTWNLMAELDDEGYRPSYGTFHLIRAQLARFRKPGSPGSMRVAAALGLRGTPIEETAESGYLILTDAPESFPLQLHAPIANGRAVYLAEAEAMPYVVSLEVLTPGRIGWYRTKLWPTATEGPGLSDLLLYEPTGLDEPDSLLAATALMLPSADLPADQVEVGVYWETYGLRPGGPVEFEVEIRREEGGLIDRIRRLLPGGPLDGPGRLSWSEPASEGSLGRALILDLGNLDPGGYTLVLRAFQEGFEVIQTERVLTVQPG